LVSIDNAETNKLVAMTTITSLAARVPSALQIITVAKRRKIINGVKRVRATWVVYDLGKM
jgi:hypothetical protein